MASFAAGAILIGNNPKEWNFLKIIYLLFTGGAFGFNLIILIICTMCSMWGPGRALRGEGVESINYALTVMESSVNHVHVLFVLGISCYFASSFVVTFLTFNIFAAIIGTLILIGMMVWTVLGVLKLRKELFFEEITTGVLRGHFLTGRPTDGNAEGDVVRQAADVASYGGSKQSEQETLLTEQNLELQQQSIDDNNGVLSRAGRYQGNIQDALQRGATRAQEQASNIGGRATELFRNIRR
eukprot:Filipodium_phascolosomae@DN3570_c0_g1_i1.p1